MHVHVSSSDGEAKFWLEPKVGLAKNYGYSDKRLKQIEQLIEEHYDELTSAWRGYFGD